MQQVVLNQYEKIGSTDMNNIQFAIAQMIQEQLLYNFYQRSGGGAIGTGFAPSYTSAFVASLAAGVGFYYDSSQTGFVSKFREMFSSTAITVNITANSNANNRIDLVSLAPNFAVTATASRYVKTGGVGPVTLQTVNKLMQDGYTLTVTAGTPSASPSAPALPAGNIAIAQILNHGSSAGMSSGASDVTDVRTVLTIANNLLVGPVAVSANTVVSRIHQNQVLNVSAAGAINFTLPSGSGYAGFQFGINDILGTFGTYAINLIPNGTDKIMGLNANYLLQSPWGGWTFYYDGASPGNWFIR